MLTSLAVGALAALTWLPQTDTVVPLQGARRLELESMGGEIVVRTWERDAVHIQAEHSSRTRIGVDRHGDVLSLRTEAERGPATIVDLQLTVPAALNLAIAGWHTPVTIEGVAGEVEVETLEGSIDIRGGSGRVIAQATNGEVVIHGARGRVEAAAVAGTVRVVDCSGEIFAETVSGNLVLENIVASTVEAGTVSGNVSFAGAIEDGGRYAFGAHSGRIELYLPPGVNASVTTASLTGSVQSDYPGAPTEFESKKRSSFTLGTGSARIEVETFSGGIVIKRRGS